MTFDIFVTVKGAYEFAFKPDVTKSVVILIDGVVKYSNNVMMYPRSDWTNSIIPIPLNLDNNSKVKIECYMV
jgi:hypothetical protein